MTVGLDHDRRRSEMVEHQIVARGVCSRRVLDAMTKVRREGYIPSYLGEFAYEDRPLPLEEEQTISQPYIVAFIVEALELQGGERVLEVGTGSGYAAAVLAEIAGEVYTIERHASLARSAKERLARDGYDRVNVRQGDGTRGWPEAAPFDAIVVAAGGPRVPEALRRQLVVGGRLVIPVGPVVGLQELVRIRRTGPHRYEEENLSSVRFVPLVGAEGWNEAGEVAPPVARRRPPLAERIAACAEPFPSIDDADLGPLLERIGDARVVLLGEATHGTSEFYRMRAAITRELVTKRGFSIVALEADWPDAARIDDYVRQREFSREGSEAAEWQPFARFPTWMWRNAEMREFVDWLHGHNALQSVERRVRFAGLDLYSLYNSIAYVTRFLDEFDPEVARVARERYACLGPWENDPSAYGRAVLTGSYRTCEKDVVAMLEKLLAVRVEAAPARGERLFDAVQNAQLVADAEAYYRTMYYGARESWNLRDRHMFQTLERVLEFHGSDSRAVVWEHNSHVGDASATEMAARGEFNVGQLCRQRYRESCYSVGFGTDHGTVAAASLWDGPMELKRVRPANPRSYEWLCHQSKVRTFLLALRQPKQPELRHELTEPRLERAIGVIYRPETELASHYFQAVLPYQFDEYIWFDESRAIRPVRTRELQGVAGTYPFGL